tara:strand:- start:8686 stop:8988 length:303 start_codon:yes stop_codon:yes gene_type:complete
MKKIKLFEDFTDECKCGGNCGCGSSTKQSIIEANADGTISDDEDQRRDELEMEVYHEAKSFIDSVITRSYDIGGNFRGPGIQSDMAKQIKKAFKEAKFRL